jgi:hypothetical protein
MIDNHLDQSIDALKKIANQFYVGTKERSAVKVAYFGLVSPHSPRSAFHDPVINICFPKTEV